MIAIRRWLPVWLAMIIIMVTVPGVASAAACTSDSGSSSGTVTAEDVGTYAIWVRYSLDSSAERKLQLQTDGDCDEYLLPAAAPGTWQWGNASSVGTKVTHQFTAAKSYPVKILADEGVRVDRVMYLKIGEVCSDNSTVPSGYGDNCRTSAAVQAPSTPTPTDPNEPIAPVLSGKTTLPKPEINEASVSQVNYYIDGRLVGSTKPGETLNVDTGRYENGNHKLTTEIISTTGNVYRTDKDITISNKVSPFGKISQFMRRYQWTLRILLLAAMAAAIWIFGFKYIKKWRDAVYAQRAKLKLKGKTKPKNADTTKPVIGYVPRRHYKYHALSLAVAVMFVSGLSYAGIGLTGGTKHMIFDPEKGTLTAGRLNVAAVPDAAAADGVYIRFSAKASAGGHSGHTMPAPSPAPTPAPAPKPSPSSAPAPTPSPAPSGQIPLSQLPKGNAGTGSALLVSGAPSGAPSSTGISAFRIECGYTHMNYDDAIVYPGQQGRAHLHTYFGNVAANYASTYSSIRNSGNSSCSGGSLNRSAYWIPTVMNNGTPVAPRKSIVYYKSGYPSVPVSAIRSLPDGLKMITGSASASSSQNSPYTFIEWMCQSNGRVQPYIPTCNAGDELHLIIDFPQCWDGVNLDSADHKSHMARPSTYSGAGCPSTHPVALPHITMIVNWPIASGTTAGWRLSSDMYATSIPGGYSAHADYMEGWDQGVKNTFNSACLNAGKDCQVRWLGDGRSLQNVAGVN